MFELSFSNRIKDFQSKIWELCHIKLFVVTFDIGNFWGTIWGKLILTQRILLQFASQQNPEIFYKIGPTFVRQASNVARCNYNWKISLNRELTNLRFTVSSLFTRNSLSRVWLARVTHQPEQQGRDKSISKPKQIDKKNNLDSDMKRFWCRFRNTTIQKSHLRMLPTLASIVEENLYRYR